MKKKASSKYKVSLLTKQTYPGIEQANQEIEWEHQTTMNDKTRQSAQKTQGLVYTEGN